MSWCTIESDPGVFTSLIEDIGVKGVQVEELYSLDEEEFKSLEPVYGLVFLFKWDPNHSSQQSSDENKMEDILPTNLFFAKQVINNACATQALLSILLNSPNIELGDTLNEFKAFTGDFPPDLKGLAISNCEKIRKAHNSFAHPEPFVMEEVKATSNDDVYHFVAYLPFQNKVYELDGLKDSPVHLGTMDDSTSWISIVKPEIQKRIEKYSSSEIRFNLLALIQNRQQIAQAKIDKLSSGPSSPAVLSEIQDLKALILQEKTKRENWKIENIRRKHNYIPFIIELLKILAKKNQLQPLVDQQLKQQ